MGAAFYATRAAALLLGVAAGCGNDRAGSDPVVGAGAFPAVQGGPAYLPPADGDLLGRYIEHLRGDSRDGLRFAFERLGERAEEAVPRLVEGIHALVGDPQRFAELHNYCQAAGRCGLPTAAPALLEVLELSGSPVARSAAAEALRAIGDPVVVPDLLRHLEREVELGPRLELFAALGELGGPQAGTYLEQQVVAWLEGRGDPESGQAAWNSLLLLDEQQDLERFQRLAARVAPDAHPLQLQLLASRVELGESGLAPALRRYLDAERHPSAKLRAIAVSALAQLGDWESVQSAAQDPDPRVRLAVIEGLRSEPAAAQGVGQDLLRKLARELPLDRLLADQAELAIAVAALAALVERGERSELERWLGLLNGYPTAPGSVQALLVLKEEELADPRTVPILLRRWPDCDTSQRVDVLRALGLMRDPQALPFVVRVVRDPAEDPDIRELARITLANFGPAALESLQMLWAEERGGAAAEGLLHAFARLAQLGDGEARDLLVKVVGDREATDAARRTAIELLPKALGEEAYEPLLAARDGEGRGEVRAYLDHILGRYY